ncbi:hypothetical protein B9Z55_027646 [Caenorhabditis nigoni]|uniref:Uncharacterized protein n=1 Tax=Caenorhabditis nigoni TaxID=1611254 RepID=A0A2G5SEL0_9PELO|nr:hypothetical protein B9Z55_027646 [Caenorhabditis nigoni]
MTRSFFLFPTFSALCLFGTKGTASELRNSTSDFDALLNDTEISTQTMENTNATTSLSANKYFFNIGSKWAEPIKSVLKILRSSSVLTVWNTNTFGTV